MHVKKLLILYILGMNAGVDTVAVTDTGAHTLADFLSLSPRPTFIIPHVKDLREKVLEKL